MGTLYWHLTNLSKSLPGHLSVGRHNEQIGKPQNLAVGLRVVSLGLSLMSPTLQYQHPVFCRSGLLLKLYRTRNTDKMLPALICLR